MINVPKSTSSWADKFSLAQTTNENMSTKLASVSGKSRSYFANETSYIGVEVLTSCGMGKTVDNLFTS